MQAIRAVAAGNIYLDPAMTGQVISDAFGRRAAGSAPSDKELSGREEEVLRLLAWGYAHKKIAARLDVSVKTVEVYKTRAMEKLGMTNRIDIVRYALLQGWFQDN